MLKVVPSFIPPFSTHQHKPVANKPGLQPPLENFSRSENQKFPLPSCFLVYLALPSEFFCPRETISPPVPCLATRLPSNWNKEYEVISMPGPGGQSSSVTLTLVKVIRLLHF